MFYINLNMKSHSLLLKKVTTKFNSDEAIIRFAKKLTKMGIDQKLEEMGAKSGDKIKILDFEFEYRA